MHFKSQYLISLKYENDSKGECEVFLFILNKKRKDGIDVFFPIPLVTTKNITFGHYGQNKHKKSLKGGEKKTDHLGSQDKRNDMNFLFASYITDLEVKKPTTQMR